MGWLNGFTLRTWSLHPFLILLLCLPWSSSYGDEAACRFELGDDSTKRSYEEAITSYIESDCYLTDPDEGGSLRKEIGNVHVWQDGKLNYEGARSVYRERQDSFRKIRSDLGVAEREKKITQEGAQELHTLIGQLTSRSVITYDRLGLMASGRCEDLTIGNIWKFDLPAISRNSSGGASTECLGITNGLPEFDIYSALENACTDSSCKDEYILARKIANQFKMGLLFSGEIASEGREAVFNSVAEKNKLWDQFFYESRPMLPLDIAFTDWIEGVYDRPLDNGFNVPPSKQWFLLHPGIGIEWVDAAESTTKNEIVIYLEAIGFNIWNEKDRFDFPILRHISGVSLAAVASDRIGVDNIGAGLVFTINNSYQFGVSSYDGDVGVILSVNFMDMFRENYMNSAKLLKKF
jgi:hypothetical protein